MFRRTKKPLHPLDELLMYWSPGDPLRVRDLLNGGVLFLGRAGSGKTSSSGRSVMRAIVNHPNSGMLILAAKPEDRDDVAAVFEEAGRLDDLAVFEAGGSWRFNFLDYVGRGEPRNVVECLMMIGQSSKNGEAKGGEETQFWDAMNGRVLHSAVVPLQVAQEPLTAERIHAVVKSAASQPAELATPQWQAGYQSRLLERADKAAKSPIAAHDYGLARDFWLIEYPAMDSKLRSNVLAGVENILQPLNSGLAREMIGGATNVSPNDITNGKAVLVNFPPCAWGEVGRSICAGWKHLTQVGVLKRKAEGGDPFVTIWVDEAHQFVNSYDSTFIAQSRSHLGCLVYLTQSISSFYAALKGESGRHQTDSLCANFSHVIVHPCDPLTAKWAGAKLGRKKILLGGGGQQPAPNETVWDQLFGQSSFSFNFHEAYEQALQDQQFMVGRCGGPDNDYLCDAVIVKSGEPFSNGQNYLISTFSQR